MPAPKTKPAFEFEFTRIIDAPRAKVYDAWTKPEQMAQWFAPKPFQTPRMPIWVGGESAPALRRTVRYAHGWYPVGTNPQHPMNTVPTFISWRRFASETSGFRGETRATGFRGLGRF